MGVPNTSDHIQINISMQTPIQKPPVSSKAPNQNLKGMDFLCTLKIKIESKKFRSWIHIQIKIQMPNPSQELPASSKAPNKDLKDIDVICSIEDYTDLTELKPVKT